MIGGFNSKMTVEERLYRLFLMMATWGEIPLFIYAHHRFQPLPSGESSSPSWTRAVTHICNLKANARTMHVALSPLWKVIKKQLGLKILPSKIGKYWPQNNFFATCLQSNDQEFSNGNLHLCVRVCTFVERIPTLARFLESCPGDWNTNCHEELNRRITVSNNQSRTVSWNHIWFKHREFPIFNPQPFTVQLWCSKNK